ncbi:MAG: rod shape-determining protein MreD [bacterium]
MKLYFILLILSLILTSLQISSLPLFGIYLDIVLLIVLSVSYCTPKDFSVKFAFSAGLLVDLIGAQHFGTFTLLYTLVALLAHFLFNFFGKKVIVFFFITFVFVILEQIVFKNFRSFGQIVSQSLLSSLFAIVICPGIIFLCEKFGDFEKRLK